MLHESDDLNWLNVMQIVWIARSTYGWVKSSINSRIHNWNERTVNKIYLIDKWLPKSGVSFKMQFCFEDKFQRISFPLCVIMLMTDDFLFNEAREFFQWMMDFALKNLNLVSNFICLFRGVGKSTVWKRAIWTCFLLNVYSSKNKIKKIVAVK